MLTTNKMGSGLTYEILAKMIKVYYTQGLTEIQTCNKIIDAIPIEDDLLVEATLMKEIQDVYKTKPNITEMIKSMDARRIF